MPLLSSEAGYDSDAPRAKHGKKKGARRSDDGDADVDMGDDDTQPTQDTQTQSQEMSPARGAKDERLFARLDFSFIDAYIGVRAVA